MYPIAPSGAQTSLEIARDCMACPPAGPSQALGACVRQASPRNTPDARLPHPAPRASSATDTRPGIHPHTQLPFEACGLMFCPVVTRGLVPGAITPAGARLVNELEDGYTQSVGDAV